MKPVIPHIRERYIRSWALDVMVILVALWFWLVSFKLVFLTPRAGVNEATK